MEKLGTAFIARRATKEIYHFFVSSWEINGQSMACLYILTKNIWSNVKENNINSLPSTLNNKCQDKATHNSWLKSFILIQTRLGGTFNVINYSYLLSFNSLRLQWEQLLIFGRVVVIYSPFRPFAENSMSHLHAGRMTKFRPRVKIVQRKICYR